MRPHQVLGPVVRARGWLWTATRSGSQAGLESLTNLRAEAGRGIFVSPREVKRSRCRASAMHSRQSGWRKDPGQPTPRGIFRRSKSADGGEGGCAVMRCPHEAARRKAAESGFGHQSVRSLRWELRNYLAGSAGRAFSPARTSSSSLPFFDLSRMRADAAGMDCASLGSDRRQAKDLPQPEGLSAACPLPPVSQRLSAVSRPISSCVSSRTSPLARSPSSRRPMATRTRRSVSRPKAARSRRM